MKKVEIRPITFIYPLPTILLGANVSGKPNYNVVGNCGIMRVSPGVLYVSSLKTHYTNKGIKENKGFSVNIPSADMVEATDYCGMVSGKEKDKSTIFESFYGRLNNVPMIKEAPINIECKVMQILEIHGMEVIIGEIVSTYANESCLDDKRIPDIKKVNPLIYSLQNSYWSIGEEIGKAYSVGKNFRWDAGIGPLSHPCENVSDTHTDKITQ